jgi:hypothetical protein
MRIRAGVLRIPVRRIDHAVGQRRRVIAQVVIDGLLGVVAPDSVRAVRVVPGGRELVLQLADVRPSIAAMVVRDELA